MPIHSSSRPRLAPLRAALLALGALAAATTGAAAQGSNAFHFVAMGDMPYNPGDEVKVDRLIARINGVKPAFSIHVGDMISGSVHCTDARLESSARQLAALEAPLVFTPGDNEWADCHRDRGGGFDPLERLAKVRALMFPQPGRTLGRATMEVESQARTMADRFAPYVENVRFVKNGVHFATAHVIGSNNNMDEKRPAALAEFRARDEANAAWIAHVFAQARAQEAKAVVLAWQANVTAGMERRNGRFSDAFRNVIDATAKGARDLRKPVLVVWGDYHFYEISRFVDFAGEPVQGVTRLQVYGDKLVHAVRVDVDPDALQPFSFTPILEPENGLP
jgi:hypothetical protein